MFLIKDEIDDAVKRLNIEVGYLDNKRYKELVDNIIQKYAIDSKYRYPLWENLVDPSSIQLSTGWGKVGDYVANSKCILLTGIDSSEDLAVLINNGEDLHAILSDTYGFVFYVTNPNIDYLLCFNDHDFLIACGDAKNWIYLISPRLV